MKIQKIVSQDRRDFTAIYECEHCGATKRDYGYDDGYFHRQVVPKMKCDACGKTAEAETFRPLATKHPDWETV